MWEYCGMERTEEGLRKAIDMIRELKARVLAQRARCSAPPTRLNQSLEKAGRVADFLELGELMCIDALNRRESCGGHFRAESQTEDGEALRHDDEFAYVAAWEFGRARTASAGPAQGGPGLHGHRDEAAELQVKPEPDPEDLAPGRTPRPRARCTPTRSTDISDGHELPRDARRPQRAAQRQGRGADRLRLRLPRGHLRHVRPDDQRPGARPGGHHDLPAAHALASATATRSPSSRGAPTRSRSSRTSSSTAAPSTGSSRPAATSRPTPARPPRPTRCRCPRDNADRAFNVGDLHRLRRLRRGLPERRRRRSSWAPRSPTSASCPRASRSVTPASSAWSPSTTRGLRWLHEHRRVHRRLPQGDPAGRHLPAQQGPAHRDASRPLSRPVAR